MSRKTCKFRLSPNSTKFDVVARFHETIPTVKSVSSSEIQRINFGFLIEITILPFFHKLEISRVLHILPVFGLLEKMNTVHLLSLPH